MLGCWVTVLQCCTGSLSWLLDTRPCPSVPATPTCQMSLLCAHQQPAPTRAVLCTSHTSYWVFILFMFAVVSPNISVSSHPRHLMAAGAKSGWRTPGDHNGGGGSWILSPPPAAPPITSITSPPSHALMSRLETLSLSAKLEGRTSLADKTYLIHTFQL